MEMSRTGKAARNFMFSTLGSISVYVTAFLMQTLFIYYLGTEYNGVKGLFSSILGTLSLAELGISTAISFSLYKPLADNDKPKIQALIKFYRRAYQLVALVVGVLGVAIIPFLKYIVKGGENIQHMTLIYVLYLIDTVLSYLIIYKSTLLEADQKSYLMTNIYTVSNLVMVVIQSVIIVVYRNFILFLLVQIIMGFISRLIVNRYVDKMYPYIKEANDSALTSEERSTIFRKIKALLVHKIGFVTITQTDNIIMSGFINITTVGICCNFTMIIRIINELVTSFFVASAPGLGNVIATESPDRKMSVFKKYDFLVFVLYGWSAICLYFLLIPFVTVWLGADKLIDGLSVFLLCVNFYFTGQRISLDNTKTAAGIVEQDAPLSVIEAIVNIVVSIVGVIYLGLPGIFLGTFVSSLIPNIGKPIVLYKYFFGISSREYFVRYILRILALIGCGGLIYLFIYLLGAAMPVAGPIVSLIVTFLLCMFVPAVVLGVLYHRSEEWKYCVGLIRKFIVRK